MAAVDRAAREDAHADAVGEAHEEEVLNVLRRAHPVLADRHAVGVVLEQDLQRPLEDFPHVDLREAPELVGPEGDAPLGVDLPGKGDREALDRARGGLPEQLGGGLLHEAEDVLPLPPLGGPPDAGEHPAAQVADHAGESGEVDVQPDDEVVLQVDVEAGGVASRALRPDGQLTEDAPLEQDGAEVGDAAPAQPGEGLDLPLGDGRVGADAVKDAFHIGAAHVVMVHGALQGEAPFL